MSRLCQITNKGPQVGNNVSHANNKTKRRFLPNVRKHRFWFASENRFISLTLSAAGMRTVDKKGVEAIVLELRKKGIKV